MPIICAYSDSIIVKWVSVSCAMRSNTARTAGSMMREAVSLMGGYGVTEDCPGFLGQKWMDAQLEATYEGPEAVQRLQLSITMTNELFLAQFAQWIKEMRAIASERPGSGACTLASAMNLWLWTIKHIQTARDADLNLVIDGCPMDCAKKVFDRHGLTNYKQIKVTDLGIEKIKGQRCTPEQVDAVIAKAAEIIADA